MRTEEEKTRDLVLYEKKATAKDICERYDKQNRISYFGGAAALVVGVISLWGPFWHAFDTENIWGMVYILAGIAAASLCGRYAFGGIMMKGKNPIVFIKWGALSRRWRWANKDMQKLSEKFADQTAFEDDVQRAEERLLAVSERIIAFAEAKGIDHRTEF